MIESTNRTGWKDIIIIDSGTDFEKNEGTTVVPISTFKIRLGDPLSQDSLINYLQAVWVSTQNPEVMEFLFNFFSTPINKNFTFYLLPDNNEGVGDYYQVDQNTLKKDEEFPKLIVVREQSELIMSNETLKLMGVVRQFILPDVDTSQEDSDPVQSSVTPQKNFNAGNSYQSNGGDLRDKKENKANVGEYRL